MFVFMIRLANFYILYEELAIKVNQYSQTNILKL
jgi:hypothetical protein